MLDELKETVCQANLELATSGLVILTFGNVSGIDRRRGIVAIKPSGVPYDDLKAEDIVLVDLEGHVVEGWLNPSSDTPTHLELYRAFPGDRRRRPRPQRIRHDVRPGPPRDPLLRDDPRRPLPRPGAGHPAPPRSGGRTDYERNTGKVIVERFAGLDPLEMPAVLVAGHGPFAWGQTPDEAVENALVLEQVAKMAYGSMILDPRLSPLDRPLQEKHFRRKHGPDATYGRRRRRTMTNIPKVRLGLVAVSRDCFPSSSPASARSASPRSAARPAWRSPGSRPSSRTRRTRSRRSRSSRPRTSTPWSSTWAISDRKARRPSWPRGSAGRSCSRPPPRRSGKDLIDGRGDAYCGMLNASYNLGLRKLRPYIPEYPVGHARRRSPR